MRVAEVAELVDALGSGSSGGYPVGVRVSPSAPEKKSKGCNHRLQPFFLFNKRPNPSDKDFLPLVSVSIM